MSDKELPDIQSRILSTVLKLAENNSAGDLAREELKGSLNRLQARVDQIQKENASQTEKLNKLNSVLNDHVRELDIFRKETTNKLSNLDKNVSTVTKDLSDHMIIETKEIVDLKNEISNKIDQMLSAFPVDEKDKPLLAQHRQDHESSWYSKERWNRRKEKAYEHIFVGGAWAIAIFLAMAIWEAIKARVIP